jgi:hypothetical protein
MKTLVFQSRGQFLGIDQACDFSVFCHENGVEMRWPDRSGLISDEVVTSREFTLELSGSGCFELAAQVGENLNPSFWAEINFHILHFPRMRKIGQLNFQAIGNDGAALPYTLIKRDYADDCLWSYLRRIVEGYTPQFSIVKNKIFVEWIKS